MAADLLPVIVGGIIGLAGGFIGPWLLQDRRDEVERKKKRAEKFEELVCGLYEFERWLGIIRDIRVFGPETEEPPSPFPKVEAISLVYFPSFRGDLRALDLASDELCLFMIQCKLKRLKDAASEYSAGIAEAHRPVSDKLLRLLQRLREFAVSEFPDSSQPEPVNNQENSCKKQSQ